MAKAGRQACDPEGIKNPSGSGTLYCHGITAAIFAKRCAFHFEPAQKTDRQDREWRDFHVPRGLSNQPWI